MIKIITEEDIGKTFEASELGITFHSSKHKTLKVVDVWVRDRIKYIQLICNENASICRLLKIPVDRVNKNESYRQLSLNH